jgi:hypothetical protein
MKGMYVIPLRTINVLKKGEKYKIINADTYEYEVEYAAEQSIWINKDDTKTFEYHV